MKRYLSFALAISVVACSYVPSIRPYRMEVQQGNFVTQEMIGQIKPGMTRDQVRFALGTPLITDLFHGDRWDYIFVRQRANSQEVENRRISVIFDGDRLVRIEGDVVAGVETPPAAGGSGGKR